MAEAPIEILVVEDEAGLREAFVGILEDNFACDGIRIASAANGREAIARVTERSLLLLDLEMPVLDGYAVLAYLEQRGIRPQKGILITSSRASTPADRPVVEAKVRAAYSGEVRYMPKPVDLETFIGEVSNLLYEL
jgi:CheY-like chemotaxis protein